LIVAALVKQFGEKCGRYDERCECCRAWAEYEALLNDKALLASATAEIRYLNNKLRGKVGPTHD
jgi:hypothetical protein